MDIYRILIKLIALFILLIALNQFYSVLQGFSKDFSDAINGKEMNYTIQSQEKDGKTNIEKLQVGSVNYMDVIGTFILFSFVWVFSQTWDPKFIPLGQVPIKNMPLIQLLFSVPVFIYTLFVLSLMAWLISLLPASILGLPILMGVFIINFFIDPINSFIYIFDKKILYLALIVSIFGFVLKLAIDSKEKIANAFLTKLTNAFHEKKLMDFFEKSLILISLSCYSALFLLSIFHVYVVLQGVPLNLFNLQSILSLILGFAVAEIIIRIFRSLKIPARSSPMKKKIVAKSE